MADPCIWELGTRSGVLGYLRWVRRREVVLSAPWRVHRMISGWMLRHRLEDGDELGMDGVQAFVMDTLPERLPGLAPQLLPAAKVPPPDRWLAALDGDQMPKHGTRDPDGWYSNRWPKELEPAWLYEHSERGAIRWARGSHSGFKAGGRMRDGTALWLTLAVSKRRTTLVLRDERGLWGPARHEASGWLRRGRLQRLAASLESRL